MIRRFDYGKHNITYCGMVGTNGTLQVYAVYRATLHINHYGEPYVNTATARVIANKNSDTPVMQFDRLALARQYETVEYPAFDWAQWGH